MVKIKVCLKCKNEKPLFLFYKSTQTIDGKRKYCIACCKNNNNKHYSKNSEKIKKSVKEYRECNPEKINKNRKKWAEKNVDKLKTYYSEYQKTYRVKNIVRLRERDRIYRNDKYQKDYKLRINVCMSSRIRRALKNIKKDRPWNKYVDYTIEALIEHLQYSFKDGMNWGNYGEWEIDHIIPVSFFNLYNPEEITKCWSLNNLQPLWKHDNRVKSNKIIYNIGGVA